VYRFKNSEVHYIASVNSQSKEISRCYAMVLGKMVLGK